MGQNSEKPLKVKMKYKKSAATKKSIYNAAIAVMSEKGYQGATIRDICKRANVSPATFYSYYRSKIDIIHDIYIPGDAYFINIVKKSLEGKDCIEQLRDFASSYAKLNVKTGLEIMRVLYNPENEWFTINRPMQDVLLEIVKKGQAEGVLTPDISPQRLMENIFCILRGVCYAWCIYNASFSLEERTLELIDMFICGIVNYKPGSRS